MSEHHAFPGSMLDEGMTPEAYIAAARTSGKVRGSYAKGLALAALWQAELFNKGLFKSGLAVELGAGPGYLARGMAIAARKHSARVIGLDADPTMVAFARHQHPIDRLEFHVTPHDRIVLPEGTGKADLIVCEDMLHHAVDKAAMLHAMLGVLRKGGLLIVFDLNPQSLFVAAKKIVAPLRNIRAKMGRDNHDRDAFEKAFWHSINESVRPAELRTTLAALPVARSTVLPLWLRSAVVAIRR